MICTYRPFCLFFVLFAFFFKPFDQRQWSGDYQIRQKATKFLNGSNASIIGGTNALSADFPYIVSLQQIFWVNSKRYYHHYCAGSIVAPKVVLTAAHCIHGRNLSDVVLVPVTGKKKSKKRYIRILNTQIHENYDNRNYRNDVAVIFTVEVIPTNKATFSYIRLPGNVAYSVPRTLTVVGWGSDYSYGLMKGMISRHSRRQCKQYHGVSFIKGMICAGDDGITSCFGDSGGPLIAKGARPSKDILFGIVSWGSEKCGRRPGVYTDVARYLDWIIKAINKQMSLVNSQSILINQQNRYN